MSAFSHATDDDHGGAMEDEVTELHVGSPERLSVVSTTAAMFRQCYST